MTVSRGGLLSSWPGLSRPFTPSSDDWAARRARPAEPLAAIDGLIRRVDGRDKPGHDSFDVRGHSGVGVDDLAIGESRT
jgi:hypothetical protein